MKYSKETHFSPELQQEVKSFLTELKSLMKKAPIPTSGVIDFMQIYRKKSSKDIYSKIEMSPSSFNILKNNELNHKSNITTLKKMAYGLNCEFVYFFVPKD